MATNWHHLRIGDMDYGLGTITSQLILMIYSIKLDNLTIITSDFDVGVLFQYQSTDVPLC